MSSIVYFADLRANYKRSFLDKIDFIIQKLNIKIKFKREGLTALKIHFGEKGNFSFIRPVIVKKIIDAIKEIEGNPFLTDCGTLYLGTRSNAVTHLVTAVENGFAYSVLGVPLIIADGLKGRSSITVKIDLTEYSEAYIGSEIVESDNLVSIAHFKAHELAGFGGTIKNLGMGCASRKGKFFQHSNVSPEIKRSECIGCGNCVITCPVNAISIIQSRSCEITSKDDITNPAMYAYKDDSKCIGCGDCMLVCSSKAIQIKFDVQIYEFMRRMVAYTKAVLTGKEDRSVFFNFLIQINPACDCYPFNDAPIVADIGVLASYDPVAIDQAAVDLVNQAQGLYNSCLRQGHKPGADKFRDIYPDIDWAFQLNYAQKLGLGSREYKLITI